MNDDYPAWNGWHCNRCHAVYQDDSSYARHLTYHLRVDQGDDPDSARRNIARADMEGMKDDLVDLLAELA